MSYTIQRVSDFDFWIQDERGTPYPATFLTRLAAERVAILLSADDKQRIAAGREPVRVVLDIEPPLSPGRTQPTKTRITLTGYSAPPQKTLTIKAKDETPPQPKPKMRVTL